METPRPHPSLSSPSLLSFETMTFHFGSVLFVPGERNQAAVDPGAAVVAVGSPRAHERCRRGDVLAEAFPGEWDNLESKA